MLARGSVQIDVAIRIGTARTEVPPRFAELPATTFKELPCTALMTIITLGMFESDWGRPRQAAAPRAGLIRRYLERTIQL